jgi:hypothetical protein
MPQTVEQQLAQLPKLSRDELHGLWLENFGKPAHPKLRRQLLIPVLAYRIQERAFGALSPSVRKQLRQVAALAAESGSKGRRKQIKPGTKLLRQWHGEAHEVWVTPEGFLYRGTPFKTLSEIARHITGTRWSGPMFFGLRQGKPSGGRQ